MTELAELPSYDARLQYAADVLKKTVPVETEQFIRIAKRFHTKLLLAEKYVPSKQIPCRTTLFRVEIASEYSQTIGDDYGLLTVMNTNCFLNDYLTSFTFQVCQLPLEVLVIPGDHRTFLQGDNGKTLAEKMISIALTNTH